MTYWCEYNDGGKRVSEENPLDRFVMRPGAGWKHLAGPIWEHENGARIHVMGVVRMPDKVTFFSLSKYPEMMEGNRLVRINGGNRKRGLMAWANILTA